MNLEAIQCAIESHTPESENADIQAILSIFLQKLGEGTLRVCHKASGKWSVQNWVKKGILLCFKVLRNQTMSYQGAFDKIPLKTQNWTALEFESSKARFLPGSIVREGAYIAPNVVLMPCFINIGARIEEGTMIDTWSTVGSCAHIGKNCHISGGVGIGGVLEPIQARPTIIEDNCFIGARSEIAEGVIVEEGAVVSMGVFIGASTKIVDRKTGEIHLGRVPAYSVVIPGSMPSVENPNIHQACAVIVKQVDSKTRSKIAINELLRDTAY